MYKAISIGIHIGRKTGRRYSFFPGQSIPAPNGDLYGLPGVEWISDEPEETIEPKPRRETIYPKPLGCTIPEIKEWLDREGIEYKSRDRKARLLEILKDA